jgi:hypothetical protein
MRNRTALFSSTIVLAAVGVVAFAAPASAVDTPVAVEVTGGVLSVTNPTGNVIVPAFAASATAVNFNIVLGSIVIDDARGSDLGWNASVAAADFTAAGGLTIPLVGADYTAPAAAVTGNVTVAQTDSADVSVAAVVATGTAVGVNTATLTPTIAAIAPAGTLVGAYTTTVTHSVL